MVPIRHRTWRKLGEALIESRKDGILFPRPRWGFTQPEWTMRAFARTATLALAAAVLPMAVVPARADFLSDLARIFQPPQEAYAPAPLPNGAGRGRPRAAAAKKPPRPKGSAVVASLGPSGATPPGPGDHAAKDKAPHHGKAADAKRPWLADILQTSGARAAFRLDPTLRRGDVVVTEGGIRVFEGRSGEAHDSNEFRPIAASSVGGNRSTLLEMERVSFMRGREAKAPAPVFGPPMPEQAAPEDVPLTVAVSPKSRQDAPPPEQAAPAVIEPVAEMEGAPAAAEMKGSAEPE